MTVQIITSGLIPVSPSVTGVGDYLVVLSGGTALSAAIAGGTEDLFGVDSSTTLGQRGFQGISSGGTAIGTTVDDGATQTVRQGGTALDAAIGTSGFQIVSSGGVASGTVLSAGGYQLVSETGRAADTTLLSGGTEVVSGYSEYGGTLTGSSTGLAIGSGGTAIVSAQGILTSADVGSGGVLLAYSGSMLSGVTVDTGGHLIATPGASVQAASGAAIVSTGIAVVEAGSGIVLDPASGFDRGGGGDVLVLPGGTLQGGSFTGGADLQVFSGGSTLGVTLSASFEAISSGGFASGTVLDGGAVQYVFSGASAIGTVVNSGISIVDAGGTATDTRVNSGANQTIDGLAISTTIGSGGGLYVLSTAIGINNGYEFVGGTAIDATIDSGGYAFILGDGAVSNLTVDGGAYAVLSGGAFTLNATVDSGGTLVGSDAMAEDTTVSAGGLMLLLPYEGDYGTTVESGGTLIMLADAAVTAPTYAPGAIVVSGGVVTVSGVASVVSFGPDASGLVLASGMSSFVYAGGSESATMIETGGESFVDSGGTAFDTTIVSGGILDVRAGGTAGGAITFAGTGGSLAIDGTLASGTVISGFTSGDTIYLSALSGTAPTATLLTGNTLEVTNGTTSATLQLDPLQNFTGETFTAGLATGGTTTVSIAPPADSGSVAGNAQPVDIPLYVVPEGDGSGGYRIGIEVSLDGGATYQMYLFDTGASGFYTAYDPALWSSYAVANPQPQLISYGAGDSLTAQAVSTNVTLQTTAGTPLTLSDATVGLIDSATNPGIFDAQGWNADLTSSPATGPFGPSFQGDFGADLVSRNGLDALLPQLGDGLSNGFIVTLGDYPGGSAGQIGVLQVGLTQADIASYSTVIPMQGRDTVDTFPQSGQPTYAQELGSGTITLSNSAGTFTAPSGFVYDTGAPEIDIKRGSVLTAGGVAPFLGSDGAVSSGTTVVINAPASSSSGATSTESGWTLGFSAGTDKGENAVVSSEDSGPGYVNVALNAYFGESVMFDVADGLLGFQSIPCFAEGTGIRTPDGDRPVEGLRAGDLVLAIDGAARPITWIGRRRVDCRRHPKPDTVQPIRIRAHAFGPSLPQRDVYLSPDHALFVEGVLIPVKYLVNGDTIAPTDRPAVTYHHIALDRHDVVLAEGLAAETYLETGRGSAFAQAGTVIQAHPSFAPEPEDGVLRWEAAGYAPLTVTGPAVERARRRLDAHRARPALRRAVR